MFVILKNLVYDIFGINQKYKYSLLIKSIMMQNPLFYIRYLMNHVFVFVIINYEGEIY
jgi:hypothetical protein